METLKCKVCQKEKNIEEFRRLTGLRNKFNKLCEGCRAAQKVRNEANKERIKEYQKQYREQHKEYYSEYQQKWYNDNKELLLQHKAKVYDTKKYFNKERPKEGHRVCTGCRGEKPATLEFFHKLKNGKYGLSARCKECDCSKRREWAKNNPDKMKASSQRSFAKRDKNKINELKRLKWKTDPFFRARNNINNRMHEIMENGQYSATIGCSGTELKKHLENLFQSGMSWENYGEWHVDHKYPLSVAYKEGEESFKKACHYTNLQPLWAVDNLKKSNKI